MMGNRWTNRLRVYERKSSNRHTTCEVSIPPQLLEHTDWQKNDVLTFIKYPSSQFKGQASIEIVNLTRLKASQAEEAFIKLLPLLPSEMPRDNSLAGLNTELKRVIQQHRTHLKQARLATRSEIQKERTTAQVKANNDLLAASHASVAAEISRLEHEKRHYATRLPVIDLQLREQRQLLKKHNQLISKTEVLRKRPERNKSGNSTRRVKSPRPDLLVSSAVPLSLTNTEQAVDYKDWALGVSEQT